MTPQEALDRGDVAQVLAEVKYEGVSVLAGTDRIMALLAEVVPMHLMGDEETGIYACGCPIGHDHPAWTKMPAFVPVPQSGIDRDASTVAVVDRSTGRELPGVVLTPGSQEAADVVLAAEVADDWYNPDEQDTRARMRALAARLEGAGS